MAILRDLSIWWSFIHIFILFHSLFEPRFSRKKAVIISACFLAPLIAVNFSLFLWLGYEGYGTLMLLTLTLPQAVMYWILSKHRDGRFFFTLCLVDTVSLEVFYATSILNFYITPDTYIIMFVTRLVIYPLLEVYSFRKLRPTYIEVQKYIKKDWGVFAGIGALYYISVTLLMTYPTFITNRPEYLPVLCAQFVLMPLTYVYIIRTLSNQKQLFEVTEQGRILTLQVSNIITRVEELGSANDSFRKERHDFRHKMKAIASLVEAGRYDELTKVVDEYLDNIEKTKVVRYSQHAVIDSVLSVYIRKAKQMNIEVKMGFAFPDTYKTNPTELATALANAIENAINACEKLPQNERFLEIKVLSSPKFMVMIRNSFNGQVEFDENGIPQNPEEDHGLGTRSIAAFCEKNGGYYQFKAEGNVFTLFMYLK